MTARNKARPSHNIRRSEDASVPYQNRPKKQKSHTVKHKALATLSIPEPTKHTANVKTRTRNTRATSSDIATAPSISMSTLSHPHHRKASSSRPPPSSAASYSSRSHPSSHSTPSIFSVFSTKSASRKKQAALLSSSPHLISHSHRSSSGTLPLSSSRNEHHSSEKRTHKQRDGGRRDRHTHIKQPQSASVQPSSSKSPSKTRNSIGGWPLDEPVVSTTNDNAADPPKSATRSAKRSRAL